MSSNKFLECLKRVEVSAKSQELEKIAKCLTYAKMKEMKLKKLGWKRNERKNPFKEKVPKDELKKSRVKRSYRLNDKQFFVSHLSVTVTTSFLSVADQNPAVLLSKRPPVQSYFQLLQPASDSSQEHDVIRSGGEVGIDVPTHEEVNRQSYKL